MKLSIIFLALCAAVVVLADPINDENWDHFKLRLGKGLYNKNQESESKQRFLEAKRRIEGHNAQFNEGKVKYSMTLNEYSVLSPNQFLKFRTGKRPVKTPGKKYVRGGLKGPVPRTIDYEAQGLTTSVKNQGGCGSCFSFSTAAQIEGLMIKHQGVHKNLSSQQILDCSSVSPYENDGCDGGDEGLVFQYLIKNKGLQDWESYPYEDSTEECRYQRSKSCVSIKSYKRFADVSVADLKEMLHTQGAPICVGMFAHQSTLGYYNKGVYDYPACPSTTEYLNHAVLLVGYGVDDGVPYWKIKNSWGSRWGLNGYFKIAQSHDCGITRDVSYAVL